MCSLRPRDDGTASTEPVREPGGEGAPRARPARVSQRARPIDLAECAACPRGQFAAAATT